MNASTGYPLSWSGTSRSLTRSHSQPERFTLCARKQKPQWTTSTASLKMAKQKSLTENWYSCHPPEEYPAELRAKYLSACTTMNDVWEEVTPFLTMSVS